MKDKFIKLSDTNAFKKLIDLTNSKPNKSLTTDNWYDIQLLKAFYEVIINKNRNKFSPKIIWHRILKNNGINITIKNPSETIDTTIHMPKKNSSGFFKQIREKTVRVLKRYVKIGIFKYKGRGDHVPGIYSADFTDKTKEIIEKISLPWLIELHHSAANQVFIQNQSEQNSHSSMNEASEVSSESDSEIVETDSEIITSSVTLPPVGSNSNINEVFEISSESDSEMVEIDSEVIISSATPLPVKNNSSKKTKNSISNEFTPPFKKIKHLEDEVIKLEEERNSLQEKVTAFEKTNTVSKIIFTQRFFRKKLAHFAYENARTPENIKAAANNLLNELSNTLSTLASGDIEKFKNRLQLIQGLAQVISEGDIAKIRNYTYEVKCQLNTKESAPRLI